MNKLPPIPTPLHVRWREFRVQVLPLVVVAATVAACLYLWRDVNMAFTLSGVAEGARAAVASPQAGVIEELKVRPYQVVRAGDPIAVVTPVDPGAQLDLLRTQMQLAQLRLQPSMPQQNALDYERIRLDLLRTRAELAIAKVNLERAELDLRRNTPLRQQKLVSEQVYDFSLKARDMYAVEVEEKAKAIAEIESRMAQLRRLGDPEVTAVPDGAVALVNGFEKTQASAATNWGPITLVAPISGMVSGVMRRKGEYAIDGEPLVMINSDLSERIVGYLRQPYPVEPLVGMKVTVTPRQRQRQTFVAEVAQVGAQVEMITNALAYVRQGTLIDVGLPVVVTIPENIRLRPGEVVDMLIETDQTAPTAPGIINSHRLPTTARARL